MLGKNTFAKKKILPRKGTLQALAWFFGSAGIMFSFLAPSAHAATLFDNTGNSFSSLPFPNLPLNCDYIVGFPTATCVDFSVTALNTGTPVSIQFTGDFSSLNSYSNNQLQVNLFTDNTLNTVCATKAVSTVSQNAPSGNFTYNFNFGILGPTQNTFSEFAGAGASSTCNWVAGSVYKVQFLVNSTAGTSTFVSDPTGTSSLLISSDVWRPNANSRIISFSPTIGSSTATTTTLSATIFNNSSVSSYQSVHFHLVNSNCDVTVQTCLYSPVDISLPITFDGTGTLHQDVQLANGLYVGYVSLEPPDPTTGLRPSSVMSFTAGINPSDALITFNTAQGTSTATTTDLSQGCSTTVLGIPIGAFACFLFVPDVTTVAQIANLPNQLSGKLPFVYAFQINTIRQSVFNASGTASTSLTVSLWKLGNAATSTLTLISASQIAAVPFAGSLKSILTFLIWLGMAEYIYYRVLRIHDTNTPK